MLAPLLVAAALLSMTAPASLPLASPSPPGAPAASTSPRHVVSVKDWAEDIDAAAKAITTGHKNPFHTTSREDFERAVQSLKDDLEQLTDHQIAVRIMQLAALVGDAHTNASAGSRIVPFGDMPVEFMWLKDGLFIAAIDKTHEEFIASRVTAIGGVPIDEAMRRVGTTFGHENQSWLEGLGRQVLRRAQVLNALGLSTSPDHATFSIVRQDGREGTVELALPGLPGLPVNWVYAIDAAAPDVPYSLATRADGRWYGEHYDDKTDTLFLWYDRCQDQPKQPTVGEWCQGVVKVVDEQPPTRIVIDLRRNSGGNSLLIQPLILGLVERGWNKKPGAVFALIGRGTFSSGLFAATDLKRATKAVLAGVPTGGKPNSYGEVKSIKLPHSQITVFYSTNLFKRSELDTPSLMPDIPAEPLMSDYLAKRDVVMEAVLAYQADGK